MVPKARFVGMQRAFQEKDTELGQQMQANATLQQQLAAQQAQIEGLNTQLGEATQAQQAGRAQADQMTANTATLQAQVDMHNLVIAEYLDLAPFTPMIPVSLEGEEAQRATLQQWQERISGVVDQRVQDSVNAALRGVTPPTSPARVTNPVQGMNDEQLSARLDQILGVPGYEDEANILRDEFYRRQDAQQGA
jgi:septal ring factor EnvC (AmiA/AmiB activator)